MDLNSKLTSPPLLIERLSDGHRKLIRDLSVKVGSDEIIVPKGFVTDYSSYPRALLIVVLTIVVLTLKYKPAPLLFLLLLLIPKFSKVDIAGVVHDHLYKTGKFSKWKADKIWFKLAVSGKHRAYYWQALPGWLVGLGIAGWAAWFNHRLKK